MENSITTKPKENVPIVETTTKKEDSINPQSDSKPIEDVCKFIGEKFQNSLEGKEDAIPQTSARKMPGKSKDCAPDEMRDLPPWGKD